MLVFQRSLNRGFNGRPCCTNGHVGESKAPSCTTVIVEEVGVERIICHAYLTLLCIAMHGYTWLGFLKLLGIALRASLPLHAAAMCLVDGVVLGGRERKRTWHEQVGMWPVLADSCWSVVSSPGHLIQNKPNINRYHWMALLLPRPSLVPLFTVPFSARKNCQG